MTGPMPTRFGDVLVQATFNAGSMCAIRTVSEDGQQDFNNDPHVQIVWGRTVAEAKARSLVPPGGQIFVVQKETGEWTHLSD